MIFTAKMGLDHDNAVGLMRDMHRKLVYLDTGKAPVPEGALKACSEYCGLPFEVLCAGIEEAMTRLKQSEAVT